jgi:hypothetical protein
MAKKITPVDVDKYASGSAIAKRRIKSRIDELVDKLKTADLRLRLAGDLPGEQRLAAISELRQAKAELEEVITRTVQGVYNG